MDNQTILILDFGGQYKELIARRVRECGVYSLIKPYDISIEEIKKIQPIGIIFTGGPKSVYKEDSPLCDKEVFNLGVPVLGICYGMQAMVHILGGEVKSCSTSEYGRIDVTSFDKSCPLFDGLELKKVLMSHTDQVEKVPNGFAPICSTADCNIAGCYNKDKNLYAVQFHPEVEITDFGKDIINNFLYKVCNAKGDYDMDSYLNRQIKEIREKVGDKKVLLALSGGVDSSVCAALLSKAIPNQLVCIFVDHGLMRKNEGDEIESVFSKRDLQFVRVDASELFLGKLKGVTDPETKRKIIGKEFITVFEEQSKKFGDCKFLAQGTIYPDVIESGDKNAAVIKSHHNVGGLPKDMNFEGIIEPLRGLFKDEVRKLGKLLKLQDFLINRQPFPGPGLAIRIIGEVTRDKLEILRNADAIVREEIKKGRVKANQYFAVLTNTQSVGVMGDFRTYDYTLAVRAVKTSDFMTCEYAPLTHRTLGKISSRITNEVKGVNRVVFDITGKPPATIEWE